MNAIEIHGLTKTYGSRAAVRELTLSIRQGEVFALLGVNGAGKTTTLRVLAGLTPATSGTATLLGQPAGSEPARRCLGLSPQETAVAENLTARENLEFIARIHGITDPKAAAQAQIDALSLSEIADRRAKKLSGGWQRRLSIAMALIHQPEILILDEPTLGLDVLARRELWQLIRGLHGRTTLLLTTHYLEEAETLADRIAVMADGSLRALGTAYELMAQTGASTFEDAFVVLAGKEAHT